MMDRFFDEFTINSSFVYDLLLFLTITTQFLLNCYLDFLLVCKIQNELLSYLMNYSLLPKAWPKANLVFKRIVAYLTLSKF